jgi:hypothetical protein
MGEGMKIQLEAPEDVERPELIRTLHLQERWEEWCQLLRFLRFQIEVNFPVSVEIGESPDFIVCSKNPETTFGIELTWAAHQSWEQASAHIARRDNDRQISRNWFRGISKMGKALEPYIASKQTGSIISYSMIWSSREQAMEKVDEITSAICRKADFLTQAHYKICDRNMLLITDKMPFLLLELPEFHGALVKDLSSRSLIHDAIYFLTRLRNRPRHVNEEVLFHLSASSCAIVRRLPVSQELQ